MWQQTTMVGILVSAPSCPGSISSIPKIVFGVVEVNQQRCLEESGQWLANVDQTPLALASRCYKKWLKICWKVNPHNVQTLIFKSKIFYVLAYEVNFLIYNGYSRYTFTCIEPKMYLKTSIDCVNHNDNFDLGVWRWADIKIIPCILRRHTFRWKELNTNVSK